MYVGYYASDRFPYPQNQGGPFNAFPGSPYLAPHSVSAADVRAGMSFYRTNENVIRNYATRSTLGATAIDPTSIDLTDSGTLLMLAGVGAFVWWIFKGAKQTSRTLNRMGSAYRERRRRRLLGR
jgi:hypothetical protein